MKIKCIILLLQLIIALPLWAKDYQINDFGAKADGVFLNTRTIQYAIDYVNENGGGRIIFTPGHYLTGTVYLKSNVSLHLELGATILGSPNPFDYIKDERVKWTSLIFAIKQENIGITGKGKIDGQGFINANRMVDYINRGVVKDKMKLDRPYEGNRAENIYFRECANIKIIDISLLNPASWNQTYDQCKNLYVDNIYVDSKSYWNNDGIDVVDCDGVVIKNSFIDAADDIFCFKSHDAESICQNILLENCTGRSSANGLKFGTVSRGGFRNVVVRNITLYDTFRSAITFASVDGGIVENIKVDGVRSYNTGNVIFLRTGLRWNKGKVGLMRNIEIKNVYAEVPATKPDAGYSYEGPVEDMPRNISPASIVGIPEIPIENIRMENIVIQYPGGGYSDFAFRGTTPEELDSIPEMKSYYPEFSQFKELPAWGFYLRHAKDIIFKNVKFIAEKEDYRPCVVMDDVKGASFEQVEIQEPNNKGKNQIFDYKSTGINIEK